MKFLLVSSILAVSSISSSASAISVNFTQSLKHKQQQLSTSAKAGLIKSAFWNNVATQSGTKTQLLNSSGTQTKAKITWNSKATWLDDSTYKLTTNSNARLAQGYLDDIASGVSISIKDIPYPRYKAILYLSTSTDGGNYREFLVNGKEASTSGTKQRFASSQGFDSSNTITVYDLTGDLTIQGKPGLGNQRASVAGIQIIRNNLSTSDIVNSLLSIGGVSVHLRE